jgi:hypothetical protein
MSQIKKFIDRVSYAEARQSKDIVLSVFDAKELRDEVMKLLVDAQLSSKTNEEVIEVMMKGSKW